MNCKSVTEMLNRESNRFMDRYLEWLLKPSPFMALLPKTSSKPLTKAELAEIELAELEQRIKDANAVLNGTARVVYDDEDEW